MSAVNEWLVRDYFEFLGFFVAQPRKYQVQPTDESQGGYGRPQPERASSAEYNSCVLRTHDRRGRWRPCRF